MIVNDHKRFMILISHRGNLGGPIPKFENSPQYVREALDKGYSVEIDVWLMEDTWYLGHDLPQHEIDLNFLMNEKLWCHAKNIKALAQMIGLKQIHCFYHNTDAVTLTSKRYLWTYPGQKLTYNSICVLPEQTNQVVLNCAGVCSDYIERYELTN